MRKIPKKSNSIREKKKNSDSEKSKRSWRKSSSPGDIKQMMENAGTTDGVLPRKISAEGTKNEGSDEIATREERPIITSLNAAELMLVSADKGDLGTMVRDLNSISSLFSSLLCRLGLK